MNDELRMTNINVALPGEPDVQEFEKLIDQTQAPPGATHWAMTRRGDETTAWWFKAVPGTEMAQELGEAPHFGVELARPELGRTRSVIFRLSAAPSLILPPSFDHKPGEPIKIAMPAGPEFDVDRIEAEIRAAPHSEGIARCLHCGFTWLALAAAGTYHLPCPSCSLRYGVYVNAAHAAKGSMVWSCGNVLEEGKVCACDLFWISDNLIVRCHRCGAAQTDLVLTEQGPRA